MTWYFYGPERHPHLSTIVKRAWWSGQRNAPRRPLSWLESAVWSARRRAFDAWVQSHGERLEGMKFEDLWQLWTLGRVVRPSWRNTGTPPTP